MVVKAPLKTVLSPLILIIRFDYRRIHLVFLINIRIKVIRKDFKSLTEFRKLT